MNSRQTNGAWLKRMAALAVAGVALFGVTGCSGDQDSGASPGTAFILNGEATSERALTDATNQMTLITGIPQTRAEVAWEMVAAQAILEGFELDSEAAEEEIQASIEGYLAYLDAPVTVEELSWPVRKVVLVNALEASGAPLDQEMVQQLLAASDLTMNPRYEMQ